MIEVSALLETAKGAALVGGEVLLRHYRKGGIGKVEHKSEKDYVTEVDLESQRAIVSYVLERFPSHGILAEERGGGISGEDYRWIIDPLDGTTNFIHSFPVFAVSVAVERMASGVEGFGEIEAGAVLNPVSGELSYAGRGLGAFRNGESISVSHRVEFSDCLLATGFPFREKDYLGDFLELFSRLFHAVSGIRRAGAAALDLCWTASGALDGFWEKGLSPWDMAAGSLIVREAGGIVSGFGGEPDYLETGNIVAATPEIQGKILEALG